MRLIAPLLLPLSWLYGAVVCIRNKAYDWAWLPSRSFSFPVIVIGNLEVGGTGKTPMSEYLIRLLKQDRSVAMLSRGYGRKTKGFLNVQSNSPAIEVGDEPLQLKQKFPELHVAVCEDRVRGIEKLQEGYSPDVVVLDDAFQHRKLKPGFSILLFNYQSLRFNRWFLPAGRWRDSFREKRRADVLVVTKVPENIPARKKKLIYRVLNPKENQQVFFTSIAYGQPKALCAQAPVFDQLHKGLRVLLITGIAKPKHLLDYLKDKVHSIHPFHYSDHHIFTEAEVASWVRYFASMEGESVILTTEKDAARLQYSPLMKQLEEIPVYYVPIETVFVENGKVFDKLILSYVGASKTDSRVHP